MAVAWNKAVTCKLPVKEVASLENAITIVEIIYMLLIIVDYLKIFIDWYIDYRLDKREKESKKNRLGHRKDKRL